MSRRLRMVLALTAGFAAFAGLVVLASLPTGADTPQAVAPDGARLAAMAPVEDAFVLVLSRRGHLEAQVAYHGPKGWLGVSLEGGPAPGGPSAGTVAERVSTSGGGPVPALTAVFGSVLGDDVTVTICWADGQRARIAPGDDGTWLVARPGVAAVDSVTVERAGRVMAKAVDL